jgi:glycosyltransferase involved in cell wall biosynthesis
MVGAFPPPLHGMSAVNSIVHATLVESGRVIEVINMAAPTLRRSLVSRLSRFPRVLSGALQLSVMRRLHNGMLYMSVSGGLGQAYELIFLAMARARGMRVCLHHHSFAYLERPSLVSRWLVRLAGRGALHVTQSPGMASRLRSHYGAARVVPVSNVVFLVARVEEEHSPESERSRRKVRRLGFISNIAEEKGVLDFLDLMALMKERHPTVSAMLAGPFQDQHVETTVRERLRSLDNVHYVGPRYGADKEEFFSSIDVLLFPTRYRNETEGIVNHEALRHGVPVIAYGRGCIPEVVGLDAGRVIDPSESFVDAALVQLEDWLSNENAFQQASRAAAQRFVELQRENTARWQDVLGELLNDGGDTREREVPPRVS